MPNYKIYCKTQHFSHRRKKSPNYIIALLFPLSSAYGSKILDPELTSLHTHSIVHEHFPAILIMTAARKFFNTLAEATGDVTDTAFVLGLNDFLAPEPQRLKFFAGLYSSHPTFS